MKGALYSLLTRHSELFPCYFHHRLLAIEARVTACGAGVIGSGSFVIATTLPEMMAANCDVTYSTGNPEHLRSARLLLLKPSSMCSGALNSLLAKKLVTHTAVLRICIGGRRGCGRHVFQPGHLLHAGSRSFRQYPENGRKKTYPYTHQSILPCIKSNPRHACIHTKVHVYAQWHTVVHVQLNEICGANVTYTPVSTYTCTCT